jgi:hypothetical protein
MAKIPAGQVGYGSIDRGADLPFHRIGYGNLQYLVPEKPDRSGIQYFNRKPLRSAVGK